MGSDPINYGDDLAVLTFYFYRREDVKRIPEALAAGYGADAHRSFAPWLSRHQFLATCVEAPCHAGKCAE